MYVGFIPQAWFSSPRAMSVNGLHLLSSTYNGTTTWYVSSAHVFVSGRGPASAAVLRTLAKAKPGASRAPGIGKGSAYLVALSRIPISGPIQVRSVATGRTITVQLMGGQFSFEGAPGRYVVTGSDGNAPCAPVHVSLTSGTYSTWPPFVCQGE